MKTKGDECKVYVDHVAKLEDQYKWVLAERDSFGQGDFDFTKQDPQKVNKQYEQAEKRLEELKGKVNHQVRAHPAGKECVGRGEGDAVRVDFGSYDSF